MFENIKLPTADEWLQLTEERRAAEEKAYRESPYYWVWELQRLRRELPSKIGDWIVRLVDKVLRGVGII